MSEQIKQNDEVIIEPKFNVSDALVTDFTVQEIVMMESLLTPGLQTTVKVHSHLYNLPTKNLDEWKSSIFELKVDKPILEAYGFQKTSIELRQRVYRLANRKLINPNNEEYVLYACDDSLLNNARARVSKPWSCKTPSTVVRDVLSQCTGVKNMEIEDSLAPRDYMAENIHPFEVVKQQADVALATTGMDPSFIHYMTYENLGTHHFKSLYNLTKGPTVATLYSSDAQGTKNDVTGMYNGFQNPNLIMQYSFPCDFDLLSDLLNGIDTDGSDLASIVAYNPFLSQFSLLGDQTIDCGLGKGVFKIGATNLNSAEQQDSCNINTEQWLLFRQARMNLLEPDKVALRLTVPWNPVYHAGKVIEVNMINKNDPTQKIYGSGKYLISSMIHTIKRGGYSTTTMDCVATTVGQGGIV